MNLDVLYISDDNYADKLGISLISLVQNNTEIELCIHIFDMGIGSENKDNIQDICKEYGVTCCIHDLGTIIDKLRGLNLHIPVENNSIATLGRLFVHEILPMDVSYVLYLDCDTIIQRSLVDLCYIELNKSMAVVRDVNYYFYRNRDELSELKTYFNAGVILINLKRFRKRIQSISIEDEIQRDYLFADQDILNIAFADDFIVLPPKYNSNTRIRMVSPENLFKWMGTEQKEQYTINEIEEAKRNPIIIHYTSSLLGRPWEENCLDNSCELWRKYFKNSPWKENELVGKKLGKSNRFGRFLYEYMPERMYCKIDFIFAQWKYLRGMRRSKSYE